MSTAYVGEIRMFAGTFAPVDWAFCSGALVPISENNALFNLIGTTYGGDGQTNFALPDLRSRVPIHVGTGFVLGQMSGTESVTLINNQMPIHSHVPNCNSGSGNLPNPTNNYWAATASGTQYSPGPANVAMATQAIGNTGGSQPHDNMLPFLVVNFIIALYGVYPTQN